MLPATRKAIKELASAWRGDWNDFDGRTLRDQLKEVIQIEDHVIGLPEFRIRNGLCEAGNGHWVDHCDKGCKK